MTLGVLRATAIIAICFHLTGCFVRLPMRGTPEQRKHIGASIPTKKNLSIFTLLDGNVAIDPGREQMDAGPAQRKLLTLPKGSFITIKGLVYRRCPWGVPEYYVCRAPQQKLTFDMPTWHADQFVDLAPAQNESEPGPLRAR